MSEKFEKNKRFMEARNRASITTHKSLLNERENMKSAMVEATVEYKTHGSDC